MKAFIAGPRAITRLNNPIIKKLKNIADKNISVLIGDANGIDKAIQYYFNDNEYKNVLIYASQGKARNNIGNWKIKNVIVPPNVKGFNFYAAKDIQMAKDADFGLMLWNGKSKGTLNNIINLIKYNKKVIIYFIPAKKFYLIDSKDKLNKFIMNFDSEVQKLFTKLDYEKYTKSAEQLTISNFTNSDIIKRT